MNDIKEILKSKNFIINEHLLKNINKLNIDLNDFLLVLYFLNISNKLDIESIQKYLSLDNEKILNSFNNLIKNNLIEVIVKKDGSTIEEEISLNNFYNKVLFKEEKKEVKESDIFLCFEKEFGRTLSPIEYETINGWIENKISENTIKKALREATLNGVSNLRYIDKILYEWNKKNIKQTNDKNEKFTPLFDYDWLDDNEK